MYGLLIAGIGLGAFLLVAARDPEPAGACSGTYAYEAKKNKNLGKPPVIFGDSSMIYAAPRLAKRGWRSNARGCRQFGEGLSLLRHMKSKGDLGKVGVLALGSNGPISRGQIHEALDILGKKRILGLVTPKETGGRTTNAKLLRSEARRHSKRIRLIDWVAHSKGHPEWFAGDGIHVTYGGADAQAKFYSKRVFKLLRPAKKKGKKRGAAE